MRFVAAKQMPECCLRKNYARLALKQFSKFNPSLYLDLNHLQFKLNMTVSIMNLVWITKLFKPIFTVIIKCGSDCYNTGEKCHRLNHM